MSDCFITFAAECMFHIASAYAPLRSFRLQLIGYKHFVEWERIKGCLSGIILLAT